MHDELVALHDVLSGDPRTVSIAVLLANHI
jgi:hypothetical protein